jgi:transketolase
MAIAEAHLSAVFNKPDFPVIDNYTYVIVGDGCLQEGVASEAASLAGHLGLGKLIVLYDDNQIQIDGRTDLAFSEDVLERFRSYGWHTSSVTDGDSDVMAISEAIEVAKAARDRPSIIKIKTTIGVGSKLQGTEKVLKKS